MWSSPIQPPPFDALPVKGLPSAKALSDPIRAVHAPTLWGVGSDILRGDMALPLAVIKQSALLHNLRWMSDFCAQRGLSLAPHGKTSMSPELWHMQLQAGAWGISFANAQQALVGALHGVPVLLIANQVVQRAELDALRSIRERWPSIRLLFLIDSLEQIQAIEQWAADRRYQGRFEVLLELGLVGQRTGVRSDTLARDVAQRVVDCPVLSLAGVECYEGTVVHGDHVKDRAHVTALMDRVEALARAGVEEGWFEGTELILTAGGSAIFDLVAERLTPNLGYPVRGVLRSGCYIAHDHQRYERYLCCLGQRLNLTETLKPALEVLACVQSVPEPGRAFLSMGKRDVSHDLDLPQPIWWASGRGDAPKSVPAHWRIEGLNDQHAHLAFDKSAPTPEWPSLGMVIGFGISHACTTFDKWRWIPVVDDSYRVVDGVTTWF